jgi:hypothetical protein
MVLVDVPRLGYMGACVSVRVFLSVCLGLCSRVLVRVLELVFVC